MYYIIFTLVSCNNILFKYIIILLFIITIDLMMESNKKMSLI